MNRDYSKPGSDVAIQSAKKSLEAHGFNVEVVENPKEAKHRVLDIIPDGASIFTATSITSDTAGLTSELNESEKYVSVRKQIAALREKSANPVDARRLGSGSDYAIGSVHAVTEDGQILIASSTGSQLPNYAYGASHVIWLVGSQKIVKNLDEAFDRLEKHAFPLEDKRSWAAYGGPSSINKILVYRKEPIKDRVKIIVIKQAVGY